MKNASVRKATLLSSLLFVASYATNAQLTPVDMNGRLKVVNNKLVSQCDNPVQLRGMSSHGLQWHRNCISPAFEILKTGWGIDVLRLAMYVNEGGYIDGTLTQARWKTFIDSYVNSCKTNGIYAIIDWHILTPGNPNASITEAKEFWEYMSKTHKDKNNVIYEICNEPNGCSWADVKTYAGIIIPIIRANDPEAIILVGTPNHSSDLGSVVNDPLPANLRYNVMYTYHFYAASHMGALNDFKTNSTKIPVFVSEWGTTEYTGTGNTNFNGAQEWITFMQSAKISWANWSFSDSEGTTPGTVFSSSAFNKGVCTSFAWTDLTESGKKVKAWISSPADNFIACPNTGTCKSPNLGSDVSLCGTTGGITLNSGLTTATGRTFTWKLGSTVLSSTGPTQAITQAGTYTVTVDSNGCQKSDDITVLATLPIPNLGTDINLCNPATATLNANVSGPNLTYAWTLNNNPIAGTTSTLLVSQAGQYKVTVSATSCTSTSDIINITSSLPTVVGDTTCNGQAANLKAIGTGPFNWFDVPSGGTSLFTGNTYSSTPTATKTYYVEANVGTTSTFGPTGPGTTPWTITDYATVDKQLLFTASANVTLKSVDVSSPNAQSIKVNVTEGSTVTKTVTVSVPAGLSTVVLDAALTSGKSYRLDAVGTVGSLTFRNNDGNGQAAVYPQTVANVGTLTVNTNYGYGWSLFYNVKVGTGSSCGRVPVEATVSTCVGLEDENLTLASLRIYPNPFELGFSVLLGPNFGVVQKIEVNDMEGKLVDTRSGSSLSETVRMGEHLPAGQYFVRVISNNKVAVRPVVKLK